MQRVVLTVREGAMRCVLTEPEWLPLTAGLRHLGLPECFVPTRDEVARRCAAAGVAPGHPGILLGENHITRRALALKAQAVVEVELQATVCGDGVTMLAWSDTVAASSLVRETFRPADDDTRYLDGVTLSAFPADRLADEVARSIPAGGATPPGIEPVVLAPEDSRALVLALRAGDRAEATTVARRAGHAEPPPIMAALATGLVGEATITVRGPHEQARTHLVLCEVGWVEIHATPDLRLRHTPYDAAGLRALIHRELAAQLAGA